LQTSAHHWYRGTCGLAIGGDTGVVDSLEIRPSSPVLPCQIWPF